MPVSIGSENGDIFAGGDGSDGDLVLLGTDGTERAFRYCSARSVISGLAPVGTEKSPLGYKHVR